MASRFRLKRRFLAAAFIDKARLATYNDRIYRAVSDGASSCGVTGRGTRLARLLAEECQVPGKGEF